MSETVRLLAAARQGDTTALRELYGRHQGRLLHFLRASMEPGLRARVAPEDVLQDTLLESARAIDRFDPERGRSFYAWLVGIARNKVREAARAQAALKRARVGSLDGPVAGEQTSPSAGARRHEREERLHAALAELPERQAAAIRLRYLEGLGVAETAERLQATPSAVKSLVTRGMAELARRLGLGGA